MTLYKKLKEYSAGDTYPMHMPGHKRRPPFTFGEAFDIDITEIDGFDNLHKPEGILLDAQKKAAAIFGVKETLFLVNGGSSGILIAISACTKRNDKILLARNSHKSCYHAVELCGLVPEYIVPEFDEEYGVFKGITATEVKKHLENSPDIKVVVITSPTYEGRVSEIKEIADCVHEKGGVLIVDEAHGSHFRFSRMFPESAATQGADLVINSIHKTLPAMTQTALIHICSDRVDTDRVKHYSAVYQTSSPSYVLMSSIDSCMEFLKNESAEYFSAYENRLKAFYEKTKCLKKLKVMPYDEDFRDASKIVIKSEGAAKLYGRLIEEYGIQPEMYGEKTVLCMTSVCDDDEGMERLIGALYKEDEISAFDETVVKKPEQSVYKSLSEQVVLPCEAREKAITRMELAKSTGEIAADYVTLYPPGIPLLVPGERISGEIVYMLQGLTQQGYNLTGVEENLIKVVEKRCKT